MKYEFNVGDYVEMIDSSIGFIEVVWDLGSEQKIRISMKDGSVNYIYCTNKGYMKLCLDSVVIFDFQDYFKRIGKYDFTQTEKKNKIEPLSEPDNVLGVNIYESEELARKINEIIDYINKGSG